MGSSPEETETFVAEVDIPYAVAGGYSKRKVDLQLSPRQAQALRCVWIGCKAAGVTYKNRAGEDKKVISFQDTIRYICHVLDLSIHEDVEG